MSSSPEQEALERLAALRVLSPDFELASLTHNARCWIEAQLDEVHAALDARGVQVPSSLHIDYERDLLEQHRSVQRSRNDFIAQRKAAVYPWQRMLHSTFKEWGKELPLFAREQKFIAQRARIRSRTWSCAMGINTPCPAETFLVHWTLAKKFEPDAPAPWDALLRLWERGAYPEQRCDGSWSVFVPLSEGGISVLTKHNPALLTYGERTVVGLIGMGNVHLEIEVGPHEGKYVFPHYGSFTLGSGPNDHFLFEHPSVVPRHLTFGGNGNNVKGNPGRRAAVRINDRPVPLHRNEFFSVDSVLYFGECSLRARAVAALPPKL